MKEFIKKNFAILLAFILPVVLIAFVALSAYVPSVFMKTDYNFVYTSCDSSNYYPYNNCDPYLKKRFSVEDNKLVEKPVDLTEGVREGTPVPVDSGYGARIFLHDTEKNVSREITLKDAQALSLDKLLTSPDGVTVSNVYDRGPDFFLFSSGSSSYGPYLTQGNSKTKLNLINQNDRYYYRNNFQFIGWTLPGRE